MASIREKSERNGAAVNYLQSVRIKRPKVTYAQISERTGIHLDTVKRLMTNSAEFSIDQFLSIAEALGEDNATALNSLAKIVKDQGL